MMGDKEYIVSLKVSFITPIGIKATSNGPAATKAKSQFTKLFNKFKKQLDDIADLEIEVDYVECQEY